MNDNPTNKTLLKNETESQKILMKEYLGYYSIEAKMKITTSLFNTLSNTSLNDFAQYCNKNIFEEMRSGKLRNELEKELIYLKSFENKALVLTPDKLKSLMFLIKEIFECYIKLDCLLPAQYEKIAIGINSIQFIEKKKEALKELINTEADFFTTFLQKNFENSLLIDYLPLYFLAYFMFDHFWKSIEKYDFSQQEKKFFYNKSFYIKIMSFCFISLISIRNTSFALINSTKEWIKEQFSEIHQTIIEMLSFAPIEQAVNTIDLRTILQYLNIIALLTAKKSIMTEPDKEEMEALMENSFKENYLDDFFKNKKPKSDFLLSFLRPAVEELIKRLNSFVSKGYFTVSDIMTKENARNFFLSLVSFLDNYIEEICSENNIPMDDPLVYLYICSNPAFIRIVATSRCIQTIFLNDKFTFGDTDTKSLSKDKSANSDFQEKCTLTQKEKRRQKEQQKIKEKLEKHLKRLEKLELGLQNKDKSLQESVEFEGNCYRKIENADIPLYASVSPETKELIVAGLKNKGEAKTSSFKMTVRHGGQGIKPLTFGEKKKVSKLLWKEYAYKIKFLGKNGVNKIRCLGRIVKTGYILFDKVLDHELKQEIKLKKSSISYSASHILLAAPPVQLPQENNLSEQVTPQVEFKSKYAI